MKLVSSAELAAFEAAGNALRGVGLVDEGFLRSVVAEIAAPRHFRAERAENRRVADWLTRQLQLYGYRTQTQGIYGNIVATGQTPLRECKLLVGAHFDSVPHSPGADDNASAVASLLACAKIVAEVAPETPVCFVAFNCEEDGLLGSQDFVAAMGDRLPELRQVHVLEMVGYCSHEPGSQRGAAKLPLSIPGAGDFLAILGDSNSRGLVQEVLATAKTYTPELPVYGLKLYAGVERLIPDLARSDQEPFWSVGVPALMWTDTADFRNPHYHQTTDTPDTLDYDFLRRVTQLLVAQVLGVV
jgi:hypothetical protein